MPQSLQAILDGDAHSAAYETFALQRKCGMFSEQLFIDGHSSRGWDPIHYPAQRGWQFYSRLFASVGKLERVAMANFVVWGSRTFDELLSKLFEVDADLLRRALEFSVEINRKVVQRVRPAIIVVPFSLGTNRRLQGLTATDLVVSPKSRAYPVQLRSRRFTFRIDEAPMALPNVKILHVPHPSSLRLDAEAEGWVLAAMQEVIGKLR